MRLTLHCAVAGTYEIVVRQDGSSTNLAYKLELPEQPGAVQKELNIESEGSFKISVKVWCSTLLLACAVVRSCACPVHAACGGTQNPSLF